MYQDKSPQCYPLGNEEPLKDFKQRSCKVRFAIEISYSGNPGEAGWKAAVVTDSEDLR